MLKYQFTNFKLSFLIFLFSFNIIKCQTPEDNLFSICNENYNTITDEFCFNKILKFENYQLNHFVKDDYGKNILVEFTEYSKNDEKSRKLYELSSDGESIFSVDSSNTKEFKMKNGNENLDFKFVGSKNLYVDINSNQYLLCINEYNFMVELYDVNSDNNNHIWSFKSFFNLVEGEYLSYFSYEVFELPLESAYIIVFIPNETINDKITSAIFIKKFKFKSLDDNPIEDIKSVDFKAYENQKILNVFFMDDEETLVVLTYKGNGRRRVSKIMPPGDWISLRKTVDNGFNLQIYDNELGKTNDNGIYFNNLWSWNDKEKLFIKSLYLYSRYVAFIYCKEREKYFYVALYYLNPKSEYTNLRMFAEKQVTNSFDIDTSLNDFVKINDKRLAFIYTSSFYIGILIIDINENNNIICIIDYYIDFGKFTIEKISGFSIDDYFFDFGGYLVLAATVSQSDDSPKYLSMLIIFGYITGIEENLSKEEEYNYIESGQSTRNIFKFLYDYPTIINNIFGYSIRKTIEFFYVPEEIKIFINNLKTGRYKQITEYYVLCSDEETKELCYKDLNEDSYELIIEHNKEINEYYERDETYYIDYNYLISVDMNFNAKFSDNQLIKPYESYDPYNQYDPYNPYNPYDSYDPYNPYCSNYVPIINIGPPNNLEIKLLCHDFCKECYEFSLDNNNQMCFSCLDNYQYDFLYYNNKANINPYNCVPERYYYDIYKRQLSLCSSTDYCYYYNYTDYREICFKRDAYDNNQCSNEYQCYNGKGGYCFNSDSTSIPLNSPTDQATSTNEISSPIESSFRCDYDCIKTGICNFDNFDNENDDYYEKIKSCEYISKYNGGTPKILKNSNGYSLQITTVKNELNSLNENIQSSYSIIDLKDCADKLLAQKGLDPDIDLIILKYENDDKVSNGYEKSVQYEVYLPNSDIKLDLSVCTGTNINIYIPVELSEKTQRLYDNLKKQGYNLFDKNDDFYLKFCNILIIYLNQNI